MEAHVNDRAPQSRLPAARRSEFRFGTIATVAIVLVAVAVAAGQFHRTQDDAFISFRYARNLIETGSLTWNGPGHDRVEGYSNFTWTILIAVAYAVGIGPWLASKLLGLACLAATILGAMRLTTGLVGRGTPWPLLTGLFVASSGCLVSWSVEGLETPLVTALVVWSLVLVVAALHEPNPERRRRRAWAAGAALGVLALSRPEAALFGGVALGAVALLRVVDRERTDGIFVRAAVAFAVPVAAQAIFRLVYYGRITANTVYAKVGGGGKLWRGRLYAEQFVEAHGTWIVALVCAVIAAAIVLEVRRRPRELRAPALTLTFLAAYVAFIVAAGGDWMHGFRFFVHVLPLTAVIGTWALARLSAAASGVLGRGPRAAAVGAVAALIVYSNAVLAPSHAFGGQGAMYPASAPIFSATWSEPEGPHLRVALWLRENLPADSLVALSEAGIVPFHSRLPMLDYLGLNDRRVADLLHRPQGSELVADHVLQQRPRSIVMTGWAGPERTFAGRMPIDVALQRHPEFAPNYQLAKVEPLGAVTEEGTPAFAIYVRR